MCRDYLLSHAQTELELLLATQACTVCAPITHTPTLSARRRPQLLLTRSAATASLPASGVPHVRSLPRRSALPPPPFARPSLARAMPRPVMHPAHDAPQIAVQAGSARGTFPLLIEPASKPMVRKGWLPCPVFRAIWDAGVLLDVSVQKTRRSSRKRHGHIQFLFERSNRPFEKQSHNDRSFQLRPLGSCCLHARSAHHDEGGRRRKTSACPSATSLSSELLRAAGPSATSSRSAPPATGSRLMAPK